MQFFQIHATQHVALHELKKIAKCTICRNAVKKPFRNKNLVQRCTKVKLVWFWCNAAALVSTRLQHFL